MSAAGVVPKAESASLSYEPFDLLDSQSLSDETRRFRFKNDEKFLGFLVIVITSFKPSSDRHLPQLFFTFVSLLDSEGRIFRLQSNKTAPRP